MGDEEEYYFEDEAYNDDGGCEEETWETAVENAYANAKSVIDSNPGEAAAGFLGVVRDDQDKGKWSFKAYKQLVRTYARSKEFEKMCTTYETMLKFNYKERSRNDVEKAINKFIDRHTSNLDAPTLQRVLETTIRVIETDRRNYEKLWFNIKLRIAQCTFEARNFTQLQPLLKELLDWCFEGEQAEARKGTQILSVYALQIQLFSELNDLTALRSIYNSASKISSAILQPKTLGIIRECGGKMYMRQSQWKEAYEAFFQAFRSFDEAGHPRRIACLKYLVLATMLSGANINPFDTNEARSYQNDPEIVAMTELINAGERKDIKAFERVLKDKKNSRIIMEDTFLYSYLEPLVRKIRCQVVGVMVKPYKTIRIDYIAAKLNVTPKEAESLVISMLLDRAIVGAIDQVAGVLHVHRGEEGGVDRYQLLSKWIAQEERLRAAITSSVLARA